MAEHFNIAIALENRVSVEKRAEIFLALREIYHDFFNVIDEVCVNNYREGTWQCKEWPAGKELLAVSLIENNLVFLYGKNSDETPGSRSSIHIDDSSLGTAFLISLPLIRGSKFLETELINIILKTQKLAEAFSKLNIIGAGWELECDISKKMALILNEYFTDQSLCLWLSFPKNMISEWPKTFVKIFESDNALLLKNIHEM